VGYEGKSMKAQEFGGISKDHWRNIAISLTDLGGGGFECKCVL